LFDRHHLAVGDYLLNHNGIYGSAEYTGMVLDTSDGGVTWTQASLPVTTGICDPANNIPCGALSGVSCPIGTSACVAVGNSSTSGSDAYTSTDNGATWTEASSGTDPAQYAFWHPVSCTADGYCVTGGRSGSFGGEMAYSSNWGADWTISSYVPPDNVNSVSCPTDSECVAVLGLGTRATPYVITSADGGNSWSGPLYGAYMQNLQGVSSAAAGHWAAVGGVPNSLS
jgi:hypothetical protein